MVINYHNSEKKLNIDPSCRHLHFPIFYMTPVNRLIYQYETTFGLYMLEPWEKALFNLVVGTFALLFLYATTHAIPAVESLSARIAYYLTESL